MKKISIIGAGRVGETTALIIAQQGLCQEVALLDVREGAAAGAALDIMQAAVYFGFDVQVNGSRDPALIADSDLVIVTAGSPRKPGMSRSDVLKINSTIIDSIVDQVLEHTPDALLLIVSNPVDILTWHAWKRTGWEKGRVFGQAGVLDGARMAYFIARETGASFKDIQAMVIGGHGDSMVPLLSFSSVYGVNAATLLDPAASARIIEHTRNGGAEVLTLRKDSSAYNAPAAAICTMVDAIYHDRKRVLSCVSVLEGEYRQSDISVGVPVVLGRNGIEQVIELPLNETERMDFQQSIDSIRAYLETA
ncbi:MAG: malate dehydrogenase [Halobacteria archaeon]|nr:malate dehydrogenase [Halobacteria archaeon]